MSIGTRPLLGRTNIILVLSWRAERGRSVRTALSATTRTRDSAMRYHCSVPSLRLQRV